MSNNKEIIKELLLKAEKCTDIQMQKAIQKKIEILKESKESKGYQDRMNLIQK